MDKKLEMVITKLKSSWNTMDIKKLDEIQELFSILAAEGIDRNRDYPPRGIELYRDQELGFILTVYSENIGEYRIPHNHGNSWVIYSVVEGIVEMGSYINWIKSPEESQLMAKNKILLKSGNAEIYYPGDIHDTKCLSKNAIILRLTSCDLKVEEGEGRMKRFDVKGN